MIQLWFNSLFSNIEYRRYSFQHLSINFRRVFEYRLESFLHLSIIPGRSLHVAKILFYIFLSTFFDLCMSPVIFSPSFHQPWLIFECRQDSFLHLFIIPGRVLNVAENLFSIFASTLVDPRMSPWSFSPSFHHSSSILECSHGFIHHLFINLVRFSILEK